jgi:Domain of unknown function (DUF5753)
VSRLDWQAIFDRADPPNTVVVLDEAVLHRLIGWAQVMHDVLLQLAELSRRRQFLPQAGRARRRSTTLRPGLRPEGVAPSGQSG